MNDLAAARYGRHSHYTIAKAHNGFAAMPTRWLLLQKQIDRWYAGKLTGGKHWADLARSGGPSLRSSDS
jgi:hypothetical protein